ncbi:unnamed protein product [Meganyctiphanes norvegica]|uniref:Uncharacterized protein n=1 Tax=Meganyctiphanes norvegica TaxID=48144 RepID=A0AAV2SQI7_MEGNR
MKEQPGRSEPEKEANLHSLTIRKNRPKKGDKTREQKKPHIPKYLGKAKNITMKKGENTYLANTPTCQENDHETKILMVWELNSGYLCERHRPYLRANQSTRREACQTSLKHNQTSRKT